jgi:hypothetical protein
VDEEDVAVNAFDSFYRGAVAGRFPDLRDREDLWKLLVVITCRKACNQAKHECSLTEGGGKLRSLSALLDGDSGEVGRAFIALISQEPDPGFAVQCPEEQQRLFSQLDEDARKVAQLKLEGYKNREIAPNIGRSVVTVERKLRFIRGCWSREVTP